MPTLAFRIVNVFAESPLAGNPLVVVEDGRALDDATMQALALQFNVSETTFVLPSERGTARVRIFTPTFEMPFAGHPTLGTAHVVRELMQAGDRVTLELRAGLIPVRADKDVWSLTANAPRYRAPSAARSEFASMLGLEAGDLAGDPLWIDTGAEQLIVPLASFDAVRRAQPVAASMLRYATHDVRAMAYVFARDGEQVLARFFFLKHGAVIQDPGTGPACANPGQYRQTGSS
jgi:PhzF family phenazine biosynthesis protein